MSRFDRYVLSQLLVLFGFFALVLVAVFWINRAVVLFDRLIGDGQSALVFLEFTALGLPNLIRMVLPIAAFAAAIYVTNRLNSESELTVMQATGSGPWQLARPYLAFGIIAALMMTVLTTVLLPASLSQLYKREAEISRNVTARLLSEGTFLHPTEGVTFYIRNIEPDGTLSNVFLSDRRSDDRRVSYTAAEAFLVRNGEVSNLIMVDGMAQIHDEAGNSLSTTNFVDFSYDISALVRKESSLLRGLREIPTPELIGQPRDIADETGASAGEVTEELHLRFARPLVTVSVTLIGFATLLLGGFSRFGVWRQVVIAFALLIVLETLRSAVSGPVVANAALWPLVYLPAVAGLALTALFLTIAARPGLLRRRRTEAPA